MEAADPRAASSLLETLFAPCSWLAGLLCAGVAASGDVWPGLPLLYEGSPGTLVGMWDGDIGVTPSPPGSGRGVGQQELLQQDRDGKGLLLQPVWLLGGGVCIPPHRGSPVCPISAIIKNQLVSYREQMQPSQGLAEGLRSPRPPCPLPAPGSAGVSRPPPSPLVYWG